jgi:hypothetical protein
MYRDVDVKESRLMNNIKVNLQGLLLLFIKLKEKNISWKPCLVLELIHRLT